MAAQRCILCYGELSEVLFANLRDRLGLSAGPWTFRRCQACGSAVLDPMPSQEERLAAYPQYYSCDQTPRTHRASRLLYALETRLFYGPIYRHSVRQVQRITGLRSGRMLDVGGGTGHRAALFQRAGFDCTVLEPDERALRVAREQFGLKTVSGLLETADFPSGAFDLITFYHVVEHLPEPATTLQAACRFLRPGGWVVVLGPVITGWQSRWLGARWIGFTEAPRHITVPSPEGIRSLLAASGLSLKAQASGSPLDEAGILALSLLPASSTPVAYTALGTASRVLYRLGGAALTLLLLPVANLACKLHRSSIGVFFAQKPAQSEGSGSTQKTG